MPINLCGCGHLTGYRHCPWCAAETVRQAPPFMAQPFGIRRAEPVRARVVWRTDLPFKAWRKAHREKVAQRARA